MSSHLTYIISAAFLLWNIITCALYGIDKRKAEKKQWRISEATLIGCAFLMGGIGSFLGMRVFRHKTKHLKFQVLVPVAVVLNIAVIVLLFFFGVLEF
ncbi:MAG: DUF1294 domain-containing protein [Oscillospiraceae bacterium]|nr:DUF1294 domain-containing protein [Oscillospiraceae bacterium]